MGVTSELLIYIPKGGKHITGGPLTGVVRFHLDKDTVFKNIALSLIQEGHCEWTETRYNSPNNKGRHSQRVVFRGYEKNVIQKIYLNKTTDGESKVSAGSYEHPFEIIIPENSPASMKDHTGVIRYQLFLKFKKPETFSFNKTFKKNITVYPKVESTLLHESIMASLNKTLFRPFAKKKHEIEVKLELEKAYLNPSGERKISFSVANKSDIIVGVKAELIAKTKYHATLKSKSSTEVIKSCTVKTPQIPDYSESNLFNIIPVAPNICTVKHSRVIEREYKVRVTLKVPMPHVNSTIEIPVFVGESPAAVANVVNVEEAGVSSESVEPREAPPSYWEAMQEDNGKNDDLYIPDEKSKDVETDFSNMRDGAKQGGSTSW